MKSVLFLTIFSLLAIKILAQGRLELETPRIILDRLMVDDQPQHATFTIKNSGDQPIIITRVTPMSSQIKADWTNEPLAPGKKGTITLTFTPSRFPENFNYKILIYSNAQNNREEAELAGTLVENPDKLKLSYKYDLNGLAFKTTNVNLGKVFTWQKISDTITFINTRKETVKLSVQYQPAHLQTRFIPEEVAPDQKGCAVITYDAPKKNDYGYNYESIILSINNSRDYKTRLSVSINLLEDFSKLNKKQLSEAPIASFKQKDINFGEIKKGEKVNCDFELTNSGKSDLIIRKTKASCGCTAVTLGNKTLAPGQSTTIRATFDSTGKSGRQYKTITVITNDPAQAEVQLNIQGNIKEK